MRLTEKKRLQLRDKGYWVPHAGPQELAISQAYTDVFEILFGGSRGPGKTAAGQVWLLSDVKDSRLRSLVIRRNADDLSDWIDRAIRMYTPLGASIANRPPVITFPTGAVFKTGHLKDDQAYTKYQGHEYHRMLIEELTQIPTLKRYLQLIASCRSTYADLKPQIFATANPGGSGHSWVKDRFITPDEKDNIVEKRWMSFVDHAGKERSFEYTLITDKLTGIKRIFIPATIDDNPTLLLNDPTYVRQLDSLKIEDEDLWKAWRLGDWDIFAGQAFREFRRDIHVMSPGNEFDFPLEACKRVIGFDWGYAAPGCAMWMAITPENQHGVRRIYCYRELYQNGKDPAQWAEELRMIQEIDTRHNRAARYIILPHDCFNKETGDSIADIFHRIGGLTVFKARTLERGARLNRKALTHRGLSIAPDGRPFMLIHPNCKDLIRTLPGLVYDENNPEDINSDSDDHCLVGETPVLTTAGWRRIDSLDGARITRYNAKVLRLITEDNQEIVCTPDHKILTPNGWIEAQNLKAGSEILWSSLNADNLTQATTGTYAVSTFNEKVNAYIEGSGSTTTPYPSQKTTTFTTSTEIGLTTQSQISPVSTRPNTLGLILPHQPTDSGRLADKTLLARAELATQGLLRNKEVKRLVKATDAGSRDCVYDLSIANDTHAFIANGFVVHNCYDAMSIVLLSEMPHYLGSGALKKPANPYSTQPKILRTDKQGQIHAPDAWEAMRKTKAPTRWVKDR